MMNESEGKLRKKGIVGIEKKNEGERNFKTNEKEK